MKAAYIREHGGPEVLEVGQLPDPSAGPGEVVVDVGAAALNHLDLWVRRGLPGLDVQMPHVGGSDAAGTVADVGEGVEGWEPGDRVVVNPGQWCGRCEWCARGEHSLCESYRIMGEHVDGAAAEKVRVPADSLYPLPEDVPFEEAAGVALVFQTAWRGLVVRAGLRPGETVLITGGSGGVSTAAIQIAALAGARVLAVTSGPENVERVRALGAEIVIDRLEEDFSKAAYEATGRRGVDVILDSVGEAMWNGCVRALARDGRLVTYGATTGSAGQQDIRRMFWKQVRIIGTTMAGRGEFEKVMDLVFSGRLRPVVDVVWPLERIADAHARMEEGESFGKVILVP